MNYLILFCYHLLWTCLVILSVPLSLFERRLWVIDRLIGHRPEGKIKGKTIWVHALSVGEVMSAVPLLKMLKEHYLNYRIIFTVKTQSGLNTAGHLAGEMVDRIMPMPLDFWWSIIRIRRYINPSLFILVETDLWPGTITFLKRQKVPVILVNGRISPRTYRAHKKYAPLAKRLWEALDICLMQTEIDRARLLDIGVAPHKVKTAGNIKFDQEWTDMDETEKKVWHQRIGLNSGDRLWVAGSVHQGEFEIILDAFVKVKEQFPNLRLIMAPRRLEWVEEIRLASDRRGISNTTKTDLSHETPAGYQVLILNTMGELGRIYGLAEISFVGGSLVPVGGHNLLEPAHFGQPVLFGPYTHNFELMAQRLMEKGGGKRVNDRETLIKTLRELLLDPVLTREMGLAAREFVDMNRGALKNVQQEVQDYLAVS